MNSITELFFEYPGLDLCKQDILKSFEVLKASYDVGGTVLLCGNGGSAADCEHIVGELMKGFKIKRSIPNEFVKKLTTIGGGHIAEYLQGALPAISLISHSALISAYANDVGYDFAFAQQVYGYGRVNDVLLAISTSGNAKNVLNACYVAKTIGMKVVGMSGETGGVLTGLCDVCICVPHTETAKVQSLHLPIYHALCAALEEVFFGEHS